MPSEVDICNLALANLGDTAVVASLTEASVQAQLCSRFYPIARDALLEMGTWGFAEKRAVLALLASLSDTDPLGTMTLVNGCLLGTWRYAYAVPAGLINVLAVLPPDAPGDIEANFSTLPNRPWPAGYAPVPGAVVYTPQPYSLEVSDKGQPIILTNQCSAILRYTAKVTDTTKFSPLVTLALAWLLSSMLAGPLLKGDVGAAEGKRCLQMFQAIEAQAEVSDANQVLTTAEVAVPWIAGR